MALYRRRIPAERCDILFLYDWDGDRPRTQKLREALRERGFTIGEETIASPPQIITRRYLARTARLSSMRDVYREYYAAYLLRKWNPRIVLSFEDGTAYTIFLKQQLERAGAKIINVAHGLTGDTHNFENFHFHYYFVFGQSSVDAVLRQKTRYGSTKLVKAGSFLIDPDFTLPLPKRRNSVMFFSTWLPAHVRDILLRNFEMLAAWARVQEKYELVIKHHPLEDESVIRGLLDGVPRVRFLPKETAMRESLRDVSVAMTCWSVASLEAAVLRRPTVIVNAGDTPDFLEIENYFLPRARSAAVIEARIDEMFAHYDEFLARAERYVARHLERTTDSIAFIADCIAAIHRGEDNFDSIPVTATVADTMKQ